MSITTVRKPLVQRIPIYVWLLTVVGAIVGVALAEPGDIVGNTIPSAATFAVVGLVVGIVAWLVHRRFTTDR